MRLLGEVRSPADDVILAVFYFGNESGAFGVQNDTHTVSYSNWIGAADSFQAEVAFNLAFDLPSVFGLHHIPASCVFND